MPALLAPGRTSDVVSTLSCAITVGLGHVLLPYFLPPAGRGAMLFLCHHENPVPVLRRRRVDKHHRSLDVNIRHDIIPAD